MHDQEMMLSKRDTDITENAYLHADTPTGIHDRELDREGAGVRVQFTPSTSRM